MTNVMWHLSMYALLLISAILFSSCSEKEVFCKNKIKLISNDSFDLELNLFNAKNSDNVYELIKSQTIKDQYLTVAIEFDPVDISLRESNESIKILTKVKNPKDIFSDFISTSNSVRFLINEQGLILYQKDIINSVDVGQIIENNLNNYGRNPNLADSPQYASTTIVAYGEYNLDTIATVLNEILLAHFIVIDSFSVEKFGNTICELSKENFKHLKTDFPFNLYITFDKYHVLPPPPSPHNNLP